MGKRAKKVKHSAARGPPVNWILQEYERLFAAFDHPAFCASSHIDETDTSLSVEETRQLVAAITIIPLLLENRHTLALLGSNEEIIRRRWPQIRKCITYCLTRLSQYGQQELEDAVCRFITIIIHTQPVTAHDLILPDSDIFDLAMGAWLQQDHGINHGRKLSHRALKTWSAETSHRASQLITDLTLLSPMGDREERMIALAGGDSDLIARSLMQRLRNMTRYVKHNPDTLEIREALGTYITLSNALLSGATELCFALLRNRSAAALTKALAASVKIANPRGGEDIRRDWLAGLGRVTASTLARIANLQHPLMTILVRQIVRSGVFAVFADVNILLMANWPGRDDRDEKRRDRSKSLWHFWEGMIKFLSEFPKFLHVLPVLTDVVNSFKTLSPEQASMMKRDPALVKVWNMVIEYHINMQLVDAERKPRRSNCSNCKTRFVKTLPKVCGGCKLKRYCSVRCQREDWRDGPHSSVCSMIKEEFQSQGGPCHDRAYQFITHLVRTDVRLCARAIQFLAMTQFPDIPGDKLFITVSYIVDRLATPNGVQPATPCITVHKSMPLLEPDVLNVQFGDVDRLIMDDGTLNVIARTIRKGRPAAYFFTLDKLYMQEDIHRHGPSESTGRPRSVEEHRAKFGISRYPRYAIGGAAGGRSRELNIDEWDDVDEVWARSVLTEGMSVWEGIEIAAKEMEEEKGLRIKSLYDRDELKCGGMCFNGDS